MINEGEKMKVIDMHAHIWLASAENDKRKLLKTIEEYHIDEMYVSSLSGYFPTEEKVCAMNKIVADFSRENPGCIKGYVYISPEHKNALDVLKKGIEEQNMIGAKVWVSDKCDSENMNPLAKQLIEYNVPLLIHSFKKSTSQVANESTSVNIRNLALRFPELKIIMAHVDGNCYHGAQMVSDLKNVWVDVSGSTGRTNEIEYTLEILGENRVLFGTDLPGCSFAIPYGKVLEADVSDEVKEKILYKNTEKLFDKSFRMEG